MVAEGAALTRPPGHWESLAEVGAELLCLEARHGHDLTHAKHDETDGGGHGSVEEEGRMVDAFRPEMEGEPRILFWVSRRLQREFSVALVVDGALDLPGSSLRAVFLGGTVLLNWQTSLRRPKEVVL